MKIIGDLRENSKITATGTVTGGTEGSSRVQWYKTSSSILDGEKGLEVLSTSKIAKVCDPIFFEHMNSIILKLKAFICDANCPLMVPLFRRFAYP